MLVSFSIQAGVSHPYIKVGTTPIKTSLTSPFYFRYTVIGIVSYGDICARKDYAGKSPLKNPGSESLLKLELDPNLYIIFKRIFQSIH